MALCNLFAVVVFKIQRAIWNPIQFYFYPTQVEATTNDSNFVLLWCVANRSPDETKLNEWQAFLEWIVWRVLKLTDSFTWDRWIRLVKPYIFAS